MTNSELKSCPMCGGVADIKNEHDPDGVLWVFVKCTGCGLRTRGQWTTETCPQFYEECRAEWNRRADDAPTGEPDFVNPNGVTLEFRHWADYGEHGELEGGIIYADTSDLDRFKITVADWLSSRRPKTIYWRRKPSFFQDRDFETDRFRSWCACRLVITKERAKEGERIKHIEQVSDNSIETVAGLAQGEDHGGN